jgi:transcriptional regulator of acetoin/glycerol metabolism
MAIMCVDDLTLGVLWVDAEDALLAARHHVPLLISASTDDLVVRAARELHELSFPGAAPLVCFRASGFLAQPAQFAAQWRALCGAARGGTILLTDIDKMRSPAQLLLLDALRPRSTSLPRIISGTSASLLSKVLSGEFCEELFYRLNVFHLMVRDAQ